MPRLLVAVVALALGAAAAAREPTERPFEIRVIDEETGRGVPLVELKTTNEIRYVTDSNGIVAFDEPGLLGQKVFFHVAGHGYELPADGFGFRGRSLETTPGGKAEIKLKRLNVAQRLYRVTGAGIYRDTLLVGGKAPIEQPLVNGLVMGSDSVVTAIHKGKMHWFWGDTSRPAYPLGNFHVPGATSSLPGEFALDPRDGVDLTYLVDDAGFAKSVCKMPGEGPTWIDGLVTIQDETDTERMFCSYVKVRPPLSVYERGLAEWNDAEGRFEHAVTFDLDAPIHPVGHAFVDSDDEGLTCIRFANPYPFVQLRAKGLGARSPELRQARRNPPPFVKAMVDAADLLSLEKYEAYTYLEPGSRIGDPKIERDADGRLVLGWKHDTPVPTHQVEARLIEQGLLAPHEGLYQLRDIESGKRVHAARGSVYYNAYRRRYVMIAVESGGTSMLGEILYAEADRAVGPWVYARKIVTHDRQSFYNPKQHPEFDEEQGRKIFFEGTYVNTFSGNDETTPRYNYNQVMYLLDLDDPRLTQLQTASGGR